MNNRTFFDKVALMRSAQKDFFKTRSHEALRRSMALEKEIDTEIARVRQVLNKAGNETAQRSLFDNQI